MRTVGPQKGNADSKSGSNQLVNSIDNYDVKTGST